MYKTNDDVEFHAQRENETRATVFDSWDAANAHMEADGGYAGKIDICVWTEAGAIALYGDEGAEMYNEDPDASVFERWERKRHDAPFDCMGRVP